MAQTIWASPFTVFASLANIGAKWINPNHQTAECFGPNEWPSHSKFAGLNPRCFSELVAAISPKNKHTSLHRNSGFHQERKERFRQGALHRADVTTTVSNKILYRWVTSCDHDVTSARSPVQPPETLQTPPHTNDALKNTERRNTRQAAAFSLRKRLPVEHNIILSAYSTSLYHSVVKSKGF